MVKRPCERCGAIVIEALAEPEARIMLFDASPKRFWRVIDIAPEQPGAAQAIDVYESHVATCAAINKQETEAE